MSDIESPLAAPDEWDTKLVMFQVPEGFRYTGSSTIALGASRDNDNAGQVLSPFRAAIRTSSKVTNTLELEILPFQARKAFQALPFGLPVFYLCFAAGQPNAVQTGDHVDAGDPLGQAIQGQLSVTLCAVMPDGVMRDPLYWAKAIDEAFQSAGEPHPGWTAFVNRLETQNGATAPILVLDHRGAALESGLFNVQVGGAPAQLVPLEEKHHGDLRQAAGEVGLVIPAGNATIAPATPSPPDADWQIASVEAKAGAQAQMTVTPNNRHLLITDLQTWFAKQYAATSETPAQYHLPQYTRHNALTLLVNGSESFKDIFQSLSEACQQGGGFHLTGWDMDPLQAFVPDAPAGADKEFRNLKKVAELIGVPGQLTSCFLPAKFIDLKKSTSELSPTEKWAIYAMIAGYSVFFLTKTLGLESFRTDGSGGIVLILLLLSLPIIASVLTDKDADALEPNSQAVSELNSPPHARCQYAPYPATLADNWRADRQQFPISTLSNAIDRFNVYHQKFAIIRTAGLEPKYIGYCGGVDFNPNRLDDLYHLNPQPFHDVHARIEGPAVRDLAMTFDQRWARDGGSVPAFSPPAVSELGEPGGLVTQVARTYFCPTDGSRALAFAPKGDRTILDTLLKAIGAAQHLIYIEDQYFTPSKQYKDALLSKVKSWAKAGAKAKLIVAIPAVTDQPFGQMFRDPFIKDLQQAGPEIVQVGYPRRRYTVPRCDLRAASGKLRLSMRLAKGQNQVVLGPAARVPPPPFWIAINGELMYANDEAPSSISGLDPKMMRAFKVDRGDGTHLLGTAIGKGPTLRDHVDGSAATVVELAGIYVHAKLLIVDDVFLGVGSANINRRGHYSDGECNLFALPESLKTDPANPVLALRKRLWAEMMDLPYELVEPLLTDPVTSSSLLGRSYFLGNRFVPHDAVPSQVMPLAFKGGDSLESILLDSLKFFFSATQFRTFFDGVVDPSSELEPRDGP
jgi:phosphatidylserine/phosphatidylglycerophosphate/cardiolipin synthase-like enzyme